MNSRASTLTTGKAPKVGWHDVRTRPFSAQDIESLVEYMYRSPRDSAVMQSIDFEAFPREAEYRQYLYNLTANAAKMHILAVEVKGRTIGVHQLANLQGNQADFQAYFWSVQDRGQGIATISWFKAAQYFFENFKIDMLFFRAPRDNPMSMAAVKKLPLNFVGEEELRDRLFKPGVRARVYSLSRTEFEALLANGDDDEADY